MQFRSILSLIFVYGQFSQMVQLRRGSTVSFFYMEKETWVRNLFPVRTMNKNVRVESSAKLSSILDIFHHSLRACSLQIKLKVKREERVLE